MKVAIRFRWIWVGRGFGSTLLSVEKRSRNPLSLDMGWKTFRNSDLSIFLRRNPLSLDMGWKLRFSDLGRFLSNGRNPLSLDMGWK